MTVDSLLNDFAIRSFRDQGDADYISARMALRAALVSPYLWASQQTIEKYLKCILLLNRVPAKKVKHDLGAALAAINVSGKLALDLTSPTQKFIEYLDVYGRFRYLEISNHAFGRDIVTLDRAAWELRRFCTLGNAPERIRLREGVPAPKVRLPGGFLETIIDDVKNPAREPLLWQNGFFGKRVRRRVRVNGWFKASNSPLSLNPQILDEVLKYIFLPRDLVDGYRAHKNP
jgi:hypothetical protein